MKIFGLSLVFFLSLLSATKTYAHFYDSVGVEAGDHHHDSDKSDKKLKDGCFDDPKLGLICK